VQRDQFLAAALKIRYLMQITVLCPDDATDRHVLRMRRLDVSTVRPCEMGHSRRPISLRLECYAFFFRPRPRRLGPFKPSNSSQLEARSKRTPNSSN